MTEQATVHHVGIAGLIETLPWQMGFVPRESLVIVDLRGDRVHCVARIDLPPTDQILSVVVPGAAPDRLGFQRRSDVLARLAGQTIVVEAGTLSGARRAANTAHRAGRAVGAVPGPITNPSSAGCHELIRSGIATIVLDAQDLVDTGE